MSMRGLAVGALIGGALALAACGGNADANQAAAATSVAAAAPGGKLTPEPGGKVVEIGMVTDGEGNYFEPSELAVNRGDVIRFVLKMGVHNTNFVADSNPAGVKLPPASPMLQLPGQTFDVKVDMAPGTYYYHCDPHALLGMVGKVTVE